MTFDAIHTERAEDTVARNYEIAVADMVYDATVWTGSALTTALGVCWDVAATAVPIDGIQAARLKVIEGSGLEPNALILNRKQFFHVKNCDQIVDRVKYSGHTDPKNISPQAIAATLDLDFVLVAGGHKNTADEGQAATITSAWADDNAMLARRPACQGIRTQDRAGLPHVRSSASRQGVAQEETTEGLRRPDCRREVPEV